VIDENLDATNQRMNARQRTSVFVLTSTVARHRTPQSVAPWKCALSTRTWCTESVHFARVRALERTSA
jgi:hypothetical protein